MNLKTELYQEQLKRWPKSGRHILAQFDGESIVVYQAYKPSIGRYAAEHGHFGGEFSFSRMSWIKPNFLWMMYRCGWGAKHDQETVLAVRITRAGFESILAQSVQSRWIPELHTTHEDWDADKTRSEVRLQWDPDHNPHGHPVERRAIQLGLRGETLRRYGTDWVRSIEDITAFCREQHALVEAGRLEALTTPREEVYTIGDTTIAKRVQVTA